jgi:cation transport regulator ChaB
MPYSNNTELPLSVRNAIPSEKGRSLFRGVVNARLAMGKSDSVAFAAAWGALQNAGYEKGKGDKWLKKRSLNDDMFTMPVEAQARSQDMGLNGAIHVHQTADGMAAYMPGSTHEEYLAAVGNVAQVDEEPVQETLGIGMLSALREMATLVLGTTEKKTKAPVVEGMAGNIFKFDEEQGIVYGWASVVTEKGKPVYDLDGDMIPVPELVNAVNEFMLNERVGKVMHSGEQAGTILHSFLLTDDISAALGVQVDREGWIVGYKVDDPEILAKVKDGTFTGFSIGGRAIQEEVDG